MSSDVKLKDEAIYKSVNPFPEDDRGIRGRAAIVAD